MGNNQIMISIVMPAYNSENTIKESIDSVIRQDYSFWELIVVNDFSADNTKTIVEELANNDSRIRIINKNKNEGVGAARNTGVKEAKYDWIAFLDSDDLWKSNKLSEMVKLINKHPEGKLFYTGSGFIDYTGVPSEYILNVPETIEYKKLLLQNVISCSSVVAKKKCLLENKMPCGFIHEDFATWLSILKKEKYAYGVNKPLLIYRLSKNSKSGNKIKAARMNWNTYRVVNVPIAKRIYCMIIYAYRGIKKYKSI